MIVSFRCKQTELIFQRDSRVKRWSNDVRRLALRKLLLIDAAEDVNDLRVPPGNRLERLKGDRAGQHSVRINNQWRICFVWRRGQALDVEIVDYH